MPQPQQPSSSGFINIDRYLGANQQGSARLGGMVGQDIANTTNDAAGAVGNYSTVGSNEAKAGTPTFDTKEAQSWAPQVNPDLYKQSYSSTPATAAFGGPKEKTVSYGGPSDWTGTGNQATADAYSNATAKVGSSSANLKNYGSFAGTQANLKGLTGKDSAFDTAMLQGNQPGYQQDAQNQYGNINSLWDSAKTGVGGNIDQAKTNTNNVQNQWNDAIKAGNDALPWVQTQYDDMSHQWLKDQGVKAMAAINTPAAPKPLPAAKPAPVSAAFERIQNANGPRNTKAKFPTINNSIRR